ncbi:MAG TPA: alpha/beta fold hydrolase [Thermoanaerobaculia bacterium]|nr:alpha/beta fold hydrolase [Thermoanaerobaculia bacterium]
MRLAAAASARLSPALGAALLEGVFRYVHRHPVPARERDWLAAAERSHLELAGRRLPVWSWGAGPAVLLVHGWAGRGSQMGAFAAPLAAAGFRAVAFDGPGHGAAPGRLSSLPSLIDAVMAVGAAVGPLAGLVAHSAGAAASTVAMGRGLVVPAAVFAAPAANPPRYLDLVRRWLGLPAETTARTRRRIETRFHVRFEDLDACRIAPRLGAPLLVFHDRRDAEVPWQEGSTLAASWPGARFVSTDDLGHHRILRDEAIVTEAVRFLTAARGA